jgi:hypothetical protein
VVLWSRFLVNIGQLPSQPAAATQNHASFDIRDRSCAMAPARGAMLSTLIDDFSGDEQDQSDIHMMPTPDSQPENKAPPKRKAATTAKGKGVAATSKVAKTKAVSRRVSDGKTAQAKSRKALAERTNVPNEDGNETEEVDDFDEEMHSAPVKPVKRTKATKAAPKQEVAPVKSRAKTAATATAPKKAGRAKRVEPKPEVVEDQTEAMEIEPTEIQDDTITEPEPVRKRHAVTRQPLPPQLSSRARSTSRQPDLYSRHRRAGSASDTERAGEPALRRKLGDMTRKFENLELKYRNLKELGGNESQSNFDKLKKAADQRARGTSPSSAVMCLPRSNLTIYCRPGRDHSISPKRARCPEITGQRDAVVA